MSSRRLATSLLLTMLAAALLDGLGLAQEAAAVRFVEVGATMNLPTAIGAAWGDYDSDGYPDLYVGAIWQGHRATLWHNNGDGTFTEVGVAMGLRTSTSDWEDWGAAWGDYNNDGRLDLVVGGGNHRPFLYRNDGDHFTEVGAEAAAFPPSYCYSVSWGDYNGDNWLDLYLCRSFSNVSYLYRNNGDGTFTDVTNQVGMEFIPAGGAVSAVWADYDRNGTMDLLATWGANPRLYRNDGYDLFTDMGTAAGLVGLAGPAGVSWADYDCDGY